MKSLILSTIQKERLIECSAKKVYGLSNGIIKKIDKNIFTVDLNDLLYIKLKKPIPTLFGPYMIKTKPKQIKSIQVKGVWNKVDKEHISKKLPWWIVEGFNWLIFFDIINNKVFKIKESTLNKSNLFIPDYGILQSGKDRELLYLIKKRGNIFRKI